MKFLRRKMSSFFILNPSAENCEETNSRGFDRTGWKKKDEERKKEKESEENQGNQAFRPIMEQVLGKSLERSEGTSGIAQ